MKDETTRQLDPNVLAILHQAGGRWSAVAADIQGGTPRILDSTRIETGRADAIVQWLDRHNVGEVLAVVPASSVVCRTCTLPDAEPDELNESLALQAEAHLEGIAPAYRTAMAVLPAAISESNRAGLMLAWPESAGSMGLPDLHRPVRYTADIAALAALLDSERSDEPVLWVDRHNDAVAMAISHANGVALRATREDGKDDEQMTRGIQRALAETAFNVGHSGGYVGELTQSAAQHLSNIRADDAALLLPADLKMRLSNRVNGAGADNQWWSDYGIAVGALLARTGSLQSLTTMMAAPPAESPSVFHRIGEQLAQPRMAAIAVTAAVLLIAFAPVVFNGLRLLALNVRYSDIDARLEAVRDAKKRLTVYEELQNDAWPMSKLLADIANCTPLGIELDMVRVNKGQYVTVSGMASPREGVAATELVSSMEQQLRNTGIFSEVKYSWDEPTADRRYPFDLNATVTRPFRLANYTVEQDFGKWTHEMRRNGDPPPGDDEAASAETSEPDPTSVAMADDESSAAPPQANNGGRQRPGGLVQPKGGATIDLKADENGSTRQPEQGDASRSTRPPRVVGQNRDDRGLTTIDDRDDAAGAAPGEVPEFLSEATIKTLTRQETMAHLTKVAKATNRGHVDDETMEKLKQQQKQLLAHLDELRKSGGSP